MHPGTATDRVRGVSAPDSPGRDCLGRWRLAHMGLAVRPMVLHHGPTTGTRPGRCLWLLGPGRCVATPLAPAVAGGRHHGA